MKENVKIRIKVYR